MAMSRQIVLSVLLALAFYVPLWGQEGAVVINEIHYDPDLNYEWVEFVELHNPGSTNVDLSGWYFDEGISFTFGPGATLPAGGYVVVAQDRNHVLTKWSTAGKVFGPFDGRLSSEGEKLVLRDATGVIADEVEYQLGFPWPTVGDPVPDSAPGRSHSIQLVNPQLDNDLGGGWRSASPTPGARNSGVFAENTPPHIRQVRHLPHEPGSGDIVTITAKVTDSDGVEMVTLAYQIVDPGDYVPVTLPNYPSSNPATIPNSAYNKNWQMLPMRDDGLGGDQVAGDSVYTAQLPSSLQRHRRLVRYRLFALDGQGYDLQVPYADDPQANFAYFVYDGVPAWSGAIQPGSSDARRSAVVTYSEDLMRSLPVYHLIARATDIQNCLFNGSYDNTAYYFSGTLVYDGQVYDNIHFRVRGQASTFQTGKNKLKIDFNRGHHFQARDDYGQEYEEKWDKMNVGTGVCPWWQYPHPGGWDVGTRGMVMNEALAFRLYNMAGVPSCHTNYFQLRIIDAAPESVAGNQYEGDFWGLYFAIEHPDGAFLDEHGLPDGNVYRMDGGANPTHQGPTQIANGSDVSSFINGLSSGQTQTWWAQNVNLPNYYSSKAIGVAINDSDRRPQSNCVYYRNSETNQWWVLPWDLDLTFEWATHYTDWEHFRYALVHPSYQIACDNRARELLDLLLSSDQVGQVIDEIASIIATPYDGKTFVEANRAMWDYHPRTNRKGQFYANNEFLTTKDWAGLIEYYKTFLSPKGFSDVGSGSYGVYALLADAADSAIPNTPVVSYAGDAGYPPNGLTFRATAFSDPQGANTFASIQWRIAEVEPNTPIAPPVESSQSGAVGLVGSDNWRYLKGLQEPSTVAGAWRMSAFDDSAWLTGNAPIGFGETFIATTLGDMRYGYSTIYLRKTFHIASLDAIDHLILELRYDDGVNVWINGHLVFQDNVASTELAYNALAQSAIEMADLVQYDLGDAADVLVEGTNIIAVQVLNSSVGGSSDCFADVYLTGQVTSDTDMSSAGSGVAYQGRCGEYEIDALWESEEITTTAGVNATIPASVVESGHTYRVRCRMKDATGRWSHWSQPVQFATGAPLPSRLLSDLRVTEIMYNPPEADAGAGELDLENNSFEFVELRNVGSTTLDLTGVSFEDGIAFCFAGSRVESLPSGGFVLVVQNEAAFTSRYGEELADSIAGEYDGKLANDGETLRLVDYWNGTIAEFGYSDDWFPTTDGDGFSLTLADPQSDPNAWNEPASWRPSATPGGSPGR
ncbi:MAG: lamin tail domain-containing protein [Phycisphaerae bacterium]|nr:lamin tail domain-containing protein [Phycisphaerae bacterium]